MKLLMSSQPLKRWIVCETDVTSKDKDNYEHKRMRMMRKPVGHDLNSGDKLDKDKDKVR